MMFRVEWQRHVEYIVFREPVITTLSLVQIYDVTLLFFLKFTDVIREEK